jgi:membrane-associated phospholipid phosphatase
MPDLEEEHSLGLRLTVAAVAAVALLVPFSLIAVLIVGEWEPLFDLDLAVSTSLHGFSIDHPAWVRTMQIWSLVFSPNALRLVVLAVAIWLWRRGARRLMWWAVATMTVGGVLAAVLKLLVGRNRPELLDPVARAAGYSFPSGHALNAALAAGVLLLIFLPFTRDRRAFRAALWAAMIVMPVVTGVFRVALGVHWTSDVVAGWLMGIAVVATMAAAFELWRARTGRRPARPADEGLEPEVAETGVDGSRSG